MDYATTRTLRGDWEKIEEAQRFIKECREQDPSNGEDDEYRILLLHLLDDLRMQLNLFAARYGWGITKALLVNQKD